MIGRFRIANRWVISKAKRKIPLRGFRIQSWQWWAYYPCHRKFDGMLWLRNCALKLWKVFEYYRYPFKVAFTPYLYNFIEDRLLYFLDICENAPRFTLRANAANLSPQCCTISQSSNAHCRSRAASDWPAFAVLLFRMRVTIGEFEIWAWSRCGWGTLITWD